MMAGGEELENLAHELEGVAGKGDEAGEALRKAAAALEQEAEPPDA